MGLKVEIVQVIQESGTSVTFILVIGVILVVIRIVLILIAIMVKIPQNAQRASISQALCKLSHYITQIQPHEFPLYFQLS